MFQLSLSASSRTFISSLPFSSLNIHFDEQTAPLTVVHKSPEGDADSPLVQRVDVGQTYVGLAQPDEALREAEANLHWKPGGTIVFTGSLVSAAPATLTVGSLSIDPVAKCLINVFRYPSSS